VASSCVNNGTDRPKWCAPINKALDHDGNY